MSTAFSTSPSPRGVVALALLALAAPSAALAQPAARPAPPPKKSACIPTCYQLEAAPTAEGGAAVGCGYLQRTAYQEEQKGGFGPTYLQPKEPGKRSPAACAFPKNRKADQAVAADVEAILKREGTFAAGDAIVIPPDGRWAPMSETTNGVVTRKGRMIPFRWYQPKMSLPPSPCGTADQNVWCEANGDRVVIGFNVALYRLDEAKRLRDGGDKPGCAAAAQRAYTLGVDMKNESMLFRFGGADVRYQTRTQGTLTRQDLEAKLAAMGAEAAALHQECAGAAPRKRMSANDAIPWTNK